MIKCVRYREADLLGVTAIAIETVAVGDPGNGADSTGFGSVAYEYSIGKYEVTQAQYTEFLTRWRPAIRTDSTTRLWRTPAGAG